MASESACLIIADISGYSKYLAGVELDHAQDILADLMNVVVKAFRPGYKLSNLEGDAAFVYSVTDEIDGSVLLDTLENCYFSFQDRLLSIRQASTCECNACILIPSLNLKLVAHHGQVAIQRIAGRSELVGRDVILVHRLLKNTIAETAYLFLSDACVARTKLVPEELGLSRHVEEFESIGEVSGWVEDLEAAWARHQDQRRVYVSAEDAAVVHSGFVPGSPELVWEFISSPTRRVEWSTSITRIDEVDPSGRRRAGTLNHCMHGKDMMLQEFLDWRPPRYYTSRTTLAEGVKLVSTHEIEPVEGGSMLHNRFLRPREKAAAPVFEMLEASFEREFPEELTRLVEAVKRAQDATGAEPEPEPPAADPGRRLASSITRSG